jgi:DNA-binding transcriptional LysR family regulator
MELFGAHGDQPQQIIEADSEAVILNLIESSVGVSIVREDLARTAEAEGRITIWSGTELTTRLWFICQTARESDPVLKAALEVLHEVWHADERAPA